MKKLFFACLLAIMAMGCIPAHGQSCANSLNYVSSTLTASSQLIASPVTYGLNNQAIHICSFTIQVTQGGSAVNWGLISGTGSVCGTSTTAVTPLYVGVASVQQSLGQIYGLSGPLNLAPNQALCLSLSAAPISAVVQVTYAIY